MPDDPLRCACGWRGDPGRSLRDYKRTGCSFADDGQIICPACTRAALVRRTEMLETENTRLREAGTRAAAALSGAVTQHSSRCASVLYPARGCDCWLADRREALAVLRAALTPDPDAPCYTPNPHATPPPDPGPWDRRLGLVGEVLDREGRPWDHPEYAPDP